MKLEPHDLHRCQAEVISYTPFIMGGKPFMRTRCRAKPHWVVKETVAGKDGLRGSMTLCDSCAERFIRKDALPPSYYSMEFICQNV